VCGDHSLLKIYLDTDIGGDIHDLFALALVLSRPGAELVWFATAAEENRRRSGELTGENGVPPLPTGERE
jgi:hypothetical protein